MGETEKKFAFSREHIDAIRLETQRSSPAEHERLMRLAREAHHAFLERWGAYLRNKMSDEELTNRIIDMDAETLAWFESYWLRKKKPIAAEDTSEGITEPESGFIALKYQRPLAEELWYHFLDEKGRAEYREIYHLSSDEEGVAKIEEMLNFDTLSHEISHLYQAEGLQRWFGETGAAFYAEQAKLHRYPRGSVGATLFFHQASFFKKLLEKYGDLPHRIFFGQATMDEAPEIASEMTPEKEAELFPHWKSSRKSRKTGKS
jgi:hypothetical protein